MIDEKIHFDLASMQSTYLNRRTESMLSQVLCVNLVREVSIFCYNAVMKQLEGIVSIWARSLHFITF